jgi:MYXO-CTERM domain-containing protein
MHTVQNSGLIYLGNGLGAMGFQKSANAKNNNNNQDGHSGGVNLSSLVTVRLADLQVLESIDNVAPYQRHAFSFATTFGPGAGKPAIAVMGGSTTGIGKGKIQVVEVDALGKPTANANHRFEVSLFSDVANLPARGKRNPNNQGAGFLNGIGGVENPGFGKPQGFLPEVRTFFLSTLPGYAKDPGQFPGTNRESLWISLVPATWDDKIEAVPGPVTQNVTPGASPVVTPGNAPTQAGGPAAAGLAGVAGADFGANNNGCSCRTTGSSSGRGAGSLLLAVGVVAVLRCRRRECV